MSILHYHPFKAIYAILVTAFEACRFPLWILKYLFAAGRPNKNWTFRQAMGVRIVKAYLHHTSAIEMITAQSLRSGIEGKRWAVIQPAKTALYKGPTDDSQIRPGPVGGTWYPMPYAGVNKTDRVLLEFHGGGFVIGDGRELDAGYLCRTLIKQCGFKYAFSLQYRLSSNPKGQFPAALQDAITAYSYLIHKLHIAPERITFSGDSAGGNLALTLLRYIQEYGEQVGLPNPAGALLWSPWVNLKDAQSATKIYESPNHQTDYICAGFGSWGAHKYAKGNDSLNPYISPLFGPFATPVPLFIQTGTCEVLYQDDVELAQKFGEIKGNVVELDVVQDAPHDIALIGNLLSFDAEFKQSAKKALAFLKQNGAA